jgi:hypothetical protein
MARKKPPAEAGTAIAEATLRAPVHGVMTDALFQEICERVAGGSSLLKIEKEPGMPPRSTIWRFITANQERRALYEQARQDRADYRSERIDVIVNSVLAGKTEPNAGRVAILAEQWQAAKENPRYGESKMIEHTGSVNLSIEKMFKEIDGNADRIPTAKQS